MELVNATNVMISAKYEYGPFGEVFCSVGDMAKVNPFQFSTKYTDNETDLVYYGYRYYSPALGRWLSRDPIEEKGGLNLYSFVNNDPVNKWDKLGRYGNPITGGPGVTFPSDPYAPGGMYFERFPPLNDPQKSTKKCGIQVCCSRAITFPRAHCVIRFTYPDGRIRGCRGGPTGKGNSSGYGGSSGSSNIGPGNVQSKHCRGCCGSFGNIVAGCGDEKAGNLYIYSHPKLEEGIKDDLEKARNNPMSCRMIDFSEAACNVEKCVSNEMDKITKSCYIYSPTGANSNTTWYNALKNCGYTHEPPGSQPGYTSFEGVKTCK